MSTNTNEIPNEPKEITLSGEQVTTLYKNLRLIGQKVGDDFVYLREIYNMIDPIIQEANTTNTNFKKKK